MASSNSEMAAVCLDRTAESYEWPSDEDMFADDDMFTGMDGEEAGEKAEGEEAKGCDRAMDLNGSGDGKPVVEQVGEELNGVLQEVGLESRRGLVRSSYVIKDKHVVVIKVAIDRETTETVKIARDTKDEATIAATRQLMSKLRKRYFPDKDRPDDELVSYMAQLEEFCRMTKKLGAPSYIDGTRHGKYYSKVEVEGLSCAEGGSGAFLAEAQGAAAKGWLLVHGGNWKEVLAGRGKDSGAFAEGSEKVGLAALDSMTQQKAVSSGVSTFANSPNTSGKLAKAFIMLKEAEMEKKQLKDKPRRSPRKKMIKNVFYGSSSSSEGEELDRAIKKNMADMEKNMAYIEKKKQLKEDLEEKPRSTRKKMIKNVFYGSNSFFKEEELDRPIKKTEVEGSSSKQVKRKRPEEEEEEEVVLFSFKEKPINTIKGVYNSVIDLTKAGDDVQNPVVDLTSSPVQPAAPRRALECPLCLEELRDLPAGQSALSTPCGHLFCSGCLPAALAAAGRCPTCRVAVTADQAIRLFL